MKVSVIDGRQHQLSAPKALSFECDSAEEAMFLGTIRGHLEAAGIECKLHAKMKGIAIPLAPKPEAAQVSENTIAKP